MTYASGGIIAASDYNTLRSNGSNVMDHFSTGTGDHGMGQTSPSVPTVSSGDTITAAQWNNLISAINKTLVHQGDAAFSPSSVATGNVIAYYSTLSASSALAYSNAGTPNGLAKSDQAAVSSSRGPGNDWGTGTGNDLLTFTQTVTFDSGNHARYFFNSGGLIKLTFARTGTAAHQRDTEFSQLCTDCGTVVIGYKNTTKSGGGGATPSTLLNANNGGYWAGTGTPVTHFKQFDNVAYYSASYIQVDYHWTGTVQNGGYPVLNITTLMYSDLAGATDSITGTTTNSIVVSKPATSQIADVWGTITVSNNAPTVS